jgi:glyoxylase-like metal-dependent hydrolase (beta-lactamase superfamily II)
MEINMKVYRLPLGIISANCYVIETSEGNAAAVDIGGEYPKLKSFLSSHSLTLKKILLTHGHYDHMLGAAAAQEDTGAEIYVHEADAPMLTSRHLSLADSIGGGFFEPAENFKVLSDKDIVTLDELEFEVIHTPGHTPGSVCYKCAGELFSGDTLFKLSIGRTDFPGGSIQQMFSSLKKLSELSGNFAVHPGHNEETTLDFEKQNNPYMNGNPYENII